MGYPKFKETDYIGLNGTTEQQLMHPHFEKWQKWFINDYLPPKNKLAVFIPCAAIKPYINSPIHRLFNEVLDAYKNDIHRLVISNAGIIPYEFSDKYPFNAYDWNPLAESDDIQIRYYEITRSRIHEYLKKHEYKGYLSYLRTKSLSFNALKDACLDLDLNIVYENLNETIDPNKDSDLVLTYPENLKMLKEALEEIL